MKNSYNYGRSLRTTRSRGRETIENLLSSEVSHTDNANEQYTNDKKQTELDDHFLEDDDTPNSKNKTNPAEDSNTKHSLNDDVKPSSSINEIGDIPSIKEKEEETTMQLRHISLLPTVREPKIKSNSKVSQKDLDTQKEHNGSYRDDDVDDDLADGEAEGDTDGDADGDDEEVGDGDSTHTSSPSSSITPAKKKRFRRSYNCGPCKKQKTKCDMNLPCGNCIKHRRSDLCLKSPPKPPSPEQLRTKKIRQWKRQEKLRKDQFNLEFTFAPPRHPGSMYYAMPGPLPYNPSQPHHQQQPLHPGQLSILQQQQPHVQLVHRHSQPLPVEHQNQQQHYETANQSQHAPQTIPTAYSPLQVPGHFGRFSQYEPQQHTPNSYRPPFSGVYQLGPSTNLMPPQYPQQQGYGQQNSEYSTAHSPSSHHQQQFPANSTTYYESAPYMLTANRATNQLQYKSSSNITSQPMANMQTMHQTTTISAPKSATMSSSSSSSSVLQGVPLRTSTYTLQHQYAQPQYPQQQTNPVQVPYSYPTSSSNAPLPLPISSTVPAAANNSHHAMYRAPPSYPHEVSGPLPSSYPHPNQTHSNMANASSTPTLHPPLPPQQDRSTHFRPH